LTQRSLRLPHYVDLDWRLDVQLASRNLRTNVEPKFLLNLKTTTKPSDEKTDSNDATSNKGDVQEQLLECDYANLKHLCDELEAAVAQASGSHARRVQRYIS
jgi:COMM domain containing 2